MKNPSCLFQPLQTSLNIKNAHVASKQTYFMIRLRQLQANRVCFYEFLMSTKNESGLIYAEKNHDPVLFSSPFQSAVKTGRGELNQ